MKTRCKFQVQKVTRYQGTWEEITLSAVYANSGASTEDLSFAAATPSGTLTINVTNPAVVGKLNPGDYYYLDLIPA